MNKSEMRKSMTTWRNSLSDDIIRKQSGQICKHLIDNLKLIGTSGMVRTVSIYNAFRHEADLSKAVNEIILLGFNIAFPLIITAQKRQLFSNLPDDADMVFIQYESNMMKNSDHSLQLEDWLQPGHFGVKEPPARQDSVVAPDLILLPGLAFDLHGNRLGWGKGHYDHYICDQAVRPLCWGVALEGQIQDQVAADEHDQKVDALITPDGLINVIK